MRDVRAGDEQPLADVLARAVRYPRDRLAGQPGRADRGPVQVARAGRLPSGPGQRNASPAPAGPWDKPGGGGSRHPGHAGRVRALRRGHGPIGAALTAMMRRSAAACMAWVRAWCPGGDPDLSLQRAPRPTAPHRRPRGRAERGRVCGGQVGGDDTRRCRRSSADAARRRSRHVRRRGLLEQLPADAAVNGEDGQFHRFFPCHVSLALETCSPP